MTHLQRRMKKVEAVFTDPTGLVPHTQKWLEYWDRQYCLFLIGKTRTRSGTARLRHTVR
jgi:hypothetical protein